MGGTTWHWLGTCLRLLPNDFRLRSRYGQGVDWPLNYKDLEPFYLQAERELGVAGDSGEDLGSPRSGAFRSADRRVVSGQGIRSGGLGHALRSQNTPQARNSTLWEGRPACCGSASCIPICPVQAKYDATVHLGPRGAPGCRSLCLNHGHFVAVDARNRVEGVQFRRPDLSGGIARGRHYVIAAHGIETPRLFLHSRSDRTPAGVAHTSGQVGPISWITLFS